MMPRDPLGTQFPMPQEPALASHDSFSSQYSQLIEILYAEANCVRWELPRDSFAEALRRSADKRFRNARAGHLEIEAYLKSLRMADLGLACACAAGCEKAWEFFVAEFRPELRSAARAILRAAGQSGDARAEELADSLYAELYGVRSAGAGPRKSLFEYFHGRSKLSTWLHAVLAQRHVDLLRTNSRTVSLETESDGDMPVLLAARENPAPPDPDREMYLSRLGRALSGALAGLPAHERMILACYYTDQLTLAEIGRMLREHESTISRQLDRTRRALRESVAAILRRGLAARDGRPAEPGLDEAQIQAAFEYALEDWPFDLSRTLSATEKPGEG
jgi:RNA polymerase sigma-70 factor